VHGENPPLQIHTYILYGIGLLLSSFILCQGINRIAQMLQADRSAVSIISCDAVDSNARQGLAYWRKFLQALLACKSMKEFGDGDYAVTQWLAAFRLRTVSSQCSKQTVSQSASLSGIERETVRSEEPADRNNTRSEARTENCCRKLQINGKNTLKGWSGPAFLYML
jgi:hypothetical protein